MNVFQRYGLMEYGSVYGHGAYLGPDFTAEYLHITAPSLIRRYQDLPGGRLSAQERVAAELHENRYNGAEDTLQWSVARAGAHRTNGRLLSLRLFNQEPLSRRESGLDLQSRRHSQIDSLLRLDGLDGAGQPPRKKLLSHQQLAARAAGRQHDHGWNRDLERHLDHRPSRRDRTHFLLL